MLFPKVDVREAILSNATYTGARIIEQVQISLNAASKSKPALVALERGQSAMVMYRVDVARTAYTDACSHAREGNDQLLLAAGEVLLASLFDNISAETPLTMLEKAHNVLKQDINAQQEELIDRRAKREDALVLMQPRFDLLDVVEHNIRQYELQRDARTVRDAKRWADEHMAARRLETAAQVALRGAESARNTFGADHWLVAVMNTRRALALHLLGQHDAVAPLARAAVVTFEEWSTDLDVDNAFRVDCELMRQAAAGQLVFG
jgi:hypothetical protein